MTSPALATRFALIDAARTGIHTERLKRAAVAWRCLFTGDTEVKLASLAPYLLELGPQHLLQNPLLQSGWGESWFVLVDTDCSFDSLWRHFRKFLIVRTEAGAELYFRFYDPRALRSVLPMLNPSQLKEFFGPVKEFLLEDADSRFALRFLLKEEDLTTERIGLHKTEKF